MTRKSPQHLNLQKGVEIGPSKQRSRNIGPQIHETPSVNIQINSFLTFKNDVRLYDPTPYQAQNFTHQDMSGSSTATNTIATAANVTSHKALIMQNSRPSCKEIHATSHPQKVKKAEPDVLHLAKPMLKPAVAAFVKRQLKGGGEKLLIPSDKLIKTSDKTRSNEPMNKEGNVPIVKLAIIKNMLQNPLRRFNSKKDITRNSAITKTGKTCSRNQRLLENSFIIRTEQDGLNKSFISMPKTFSNRNDYQERQVSRSIKERPVFGCKTSYEKYPVEKPRSSAVCENAGLISVKNINLKGVRASINALKAIIGTRWEDNINGDIPSKEKRRQAENKNESSEKDSDEEDCQTVIENTCDNDYSLIFSTLNGHLS